MNDSFVIKVKLATALARHTNNEKVLGFRLAGISDLDSMFSRLDERFPGFKAVICEAELGIVDSINVYVNGDNVRYLKGLQTPLKEGDVINIIPAAAAG